MRVIQKCLDISDGWYEDLVKKEAAEKAKKEENSNKQPQTLEK